MMSDSVQRLSPPSPTPTPLERGTRSEDLRAVPWGWLDLLKIVGLFIVIGLAATGTFAVVHAIFRRQLDSLLPALRTVGLSGTLTGITLFVFVFYGALALSIYICVVRKYRPPAATLGFRPVERSRLVWAAVAWPVVAAVGGAFTALAVRIFAGGHFSNPQTQGYSNAGAGRSVTSLIALVLALAVVTPAVEETLFRGLLYPVLRRRLPVWGAVPACAIIFAGAHGIPILLPFLLTLGLALTLAYEWTRSLYPGMLIHGIQNATFAVGIWAAFTS